MAGPDDTTDPNPADAALAWYLRQAEAGTPPTRDEFLARFPGMGAELDAFLADRAAFARAAGPARRPDETVTLRHPHDPDATRGAGPAGPLGIVRYIGDYELLAEIARGGMGVVYRARQVSLNRAVAVKMILTGELASEAEVRRFRAEAEAAAALDHPNILPIYEIGDHEGRPYFSMKLVDGPGFAAVLRSAPPGGDRRTVGLLATVCRAVHFAHQRGVLHRDLKPSNVLLDADGTPYVTDFGLAKRVDAEDELTRTGAVLGTPAYIAPEQARGEKQLTTAADVYSLGAVLFEVLTGRPPFAAGSVLETLVQVRDREPDHPRTVNRSADPDLSVVALKCLEKEPAKRYESAAALADELGRWLRGEPILARPAGTAERARKWARRNPAVAALSAAVVLAVTVGSVTSVVFGLRATDEARQARAARTLADERAEDLAAAVGQLTTAQADIRTALAREVRAGYVVRVGRAHADWLANDAARARRALADCPPGLRGWEWHYLDRQFHPHLFAWSTSGPGRGVAASPDGRHAHAGRVRAVAWHPGGRLLATAGDDTTVRLWDVAAVRILRVYRGHTLPVRSLAFTTDGSRLISGGGDWGHGGEVRVWDPAASPDARSVSPPDVDRLAVTPDGTRLVVGAKDRLTVIDPATGVEVRIAGEAPVWSNRPMRAWVEAAAGRVTVNDDRGYARYDLKTGAKLPKGINEDEWFGAASDDGTRVLVKVQETGGVDVRETATGKTVCRVSEPGLVTYPLAISPDGRRFAAPYMGESKGPDDRPPPRAVGVFDADTGAKLREVPLSGDDGNNLTMYLAPGNRVLAVCLRTRVDLWAVPTGERLATFAVPQTVIPDALFAPDGSWFLFHGGYHDKSECAVWDVAAGRECYRIRTGTYDTFAASPDGRRLARGTPTGVFVLDAATGEDVLALRDATGPVGWGGGKWLFARGPDGTIRLYDGTPRP